MRQFHFPQALLPGGWADDVLVSHENGAITAVTARTPCPPGADRLDGAAVPGIPNLHSHTHQRAMAGLAERSGDGTDSFWTWREAMYATSGRLDPDGFEAVATLAFIEMLQAGTTWVAEFHYLHHDPSGRPYENPAELSLRVVAAAEAAGIGLTLLPVLYCASGFGGAPLAPGQRRFALDPDGYARLRARLPPPGPALVLGAAPHSLRAVPPDALRALLDMTPDGPIHIHVAEQPQEVADCLAHTGQRPVQWLLGHAPVGRRWCLVHATHTEPGELAALAASGAVAGLCPTTEANLGDGVFPAAAYQAAGGRFGIGSDSQVCRSPWEELRTLEYGQRLTLGRRTVLAGRPGRSTGRALLDAAWAGGAQACSHKGGAIAPGLRCDMAVLDTAHLSLLGRTGDALLDAAVFASPAPVRHVVSGGRCVVRNGRHPLQDGAAARFAQAMRDLAA